MSMGHGELVLRAATWLRDTEHCSVVLPELGSSSWEIPDAIGWQGGWVSTLVECKTSRADFFADQKKPFRINPSTGMGFYRFYMTPKGLLKPEEVPVGWGLLEVDDNKRVRRVVKCEAGFPDHNLRNEMSMLTSALRRVDIRIEKPLWEFIGPETNPYRPHVPTPEDLSGVAAADERNRRWLVNMTGNSEVDCAPAEQLLLETVR